MTITHKQVGRPRTSPYIDAMDFDAMATWAKSRAVEYGTAQGAIVDRAVRAVPLLSAYIRTGKPQSPEWLERDCADYIAALLTTQGTGTGKYRTDPVRTLIEAAQGLLAIQTQQDTTTIAIAALCSESMFVMSGKANQVWEELRSQDRAIPKRKKRTGRFELLPWQVAKAIYEAHKQR